MKESRAPLAIAILLLLVPALYVGSYLAFVVPSGIRLQRIYREPTFWAQQQVDADFWVGSEYSAAYRIDSELLAYFYWPLERLDRKLRPQTWEGAEIDWNPHASAQPNKK